MENEKEISDNQEFNKKRMNVHEFQIPISTFSNLQGENDNDSLTLSLCLRPMRRPRLSSPAQQQQQHLPLPLPPTPSERLQTLLSHPPPTQLPLQLPALHPMFMLPPLLPRPVSDPSSSTPAVHRLEAGASRPLRVRRNPRQAPREGKSATVPAPFPWATTHRATVHSHNYLLSKQIFSITGQVQCKRCEHRYEMEFDLRSKFVEVGTFIAENKSTMHDRAPAGWMSPVLPTCRFCSQENSVKPIISDKKKMINWLFLLLGQILGCCTLKQLKYFCKHTKNHRTGAKDRVLYLTYLGLCKQLDPNGPFDC